MNEKTTVYIEPQLKEDVRIKLIQNGDKQSLSSLINDLLNEWLKRQKE
jgi:Arc/MetJ-type ribon-helix-helix transcriptional regulator